jgi:exopolysaccharide biosynthesis polyprenyl glycosylphosphotransferase
MGSRPHICALAEQLACDPLSGLVVVGACVPRGGRGEITLKDGRTVPVLGSLTDVNTALIDVQADTVAVAASPGITADVLRGLSYELEGTGVDLLVAPALTNVTGTRVSIRPMAGLPLLHLEEPELSGVRKLVKTAFDVLVAFVLLVLLLPVLVAIGVAVRLTSPGPALFRQERVGRAGAPFTVLKFRSMYDDAERRLAELTHLNEHDGVLFKLRNDPRVTPLGKYLRKFSLDELPQLVNVLLCQMSLVGPRPPLPSEVARYEGHAHRRLLVKPGITGLWQVSGRSDLSWEETIRLDLQYVENWSLGLDISVLAKTTIAVFRSRGAY